MPRIACLGWGSLIWKPESLSIELPWKEDGPRVQVEFLRESSGKRITLVLDETAGLVPSLWAHMKITELADAVENLREREDIPVKYARNIGRWSKGEPAPALIDDLPGWAQAQGVDAVIWTGLGRKFGDNRKTPASAEQIIEHLNNLAEPERAGAREYISRAPEQVKTAYRKRIEEALGWKPEDGAAEP